MPSQCFVAYQLLRFADNLKQPPKLIVLSVVHVAMQQHDTHVVMIFAGYGIKQKAEYRAVTPYGIAPTLALNENTTIPSGATGQWLVEVLQK